MSEKWGCYFSKGLILITFAFIQTFLILNQLEHIHFSNKKIIFRNINSLLKGDLFFTGIPVACIGNRGRFLGHIKLYNYSEDKYFVEYTPIKIQYFFPEDRKIRNLINGWVKIEENEVL